MVSLHHASLSAKEATMNWPPTAISGPNAAQSIKKRKREEAEVHAAAKELKLWCTAATLPSAGDEIDLQLEDSPLPPEWQRCLDIKSGRIHFYNTSTQRRTTRDPRRQGIDPPPCSRPSLCLDLDLNLGCESRAAAAEVEEEEDESRKEELDEDVDEKKAVGGKSPASAATESDGCREMIAAVCMRCHMLVMLCRSTPSCPNCKFLHPLPEKAGSPPSAAVVKAELRRKCG